MFQRFTDRARRVVVLAQEEARSLFHDHIGTEHLLLGLLAEGQGIAAQALTRMGVSADAVRERIVEMVGRGDQSPGGHIPFTKKAKESLELGLREAIQVGHDHIGTEHQLLGLLRMEESVAFQILESLGVDGEEARRTVMDLLGDAGERIVMEAPRPGVRQVPATPLTRADQDPTLVSLLFVVVALVAVVVGPPTPQIRLWGLSLLLGGVLVWAGGAIIGTAAGSGPRARGMGRLLRVLGGLTLAAAASVFVLGAMLG